MTDIQILPSEKLTSETSDMQVESQTSDKGTCDKMAVIGFGLHWIFVLCKAVEEFPKGKCLQSEERHYDGSGLRAWIGKMCLRGLGWFRDSQEGWVGGGVGGGGGGGGGREGGDGGAK